jgi:tRNA nucleotidyltransferase (CCA-adding enzyme)
VSGVRPVAPPAVRWITRTLEKSGFDTWAVGGAVRDALLEHTSGDWDLATRARPAEVRRIFRRTVPIGVEHGTVGVLARDGTMYEVTTFRKDVQTDGRHAVVEFAQTIDEDLARRDFTINAIAWHPLREEIRDPFGGASDLRHRVLRAVGTPEERFREDYLRVLRALRFAGRFRLEVHPDTWAGVRALVDRLEALSPERIREELMKVLGQDPTPSRALALYADSGALRVLYPELEKLRGAGGWARTLAVVDHLPAHMPYLRLASLLREVPASSVAALLLRLRLSNALTDEVAHNAGAPSLPSAASADAEVRRWLSRHGPRRVGPVARVDLARARVSGGGRDEYDLVEASPVLTPPEVVAAWRRARAVVRARPPLTVGDLALDGRGLKELGLRPGPAFGRILEALLDWVIEDPARNQLDLLRRRALEVSARAGEETAEARGGQAADG